MKKLILVLIIGFGIAHAINADTITTSKLQQTGLEEKALAELADDMNRIYNFTIDADTIITTSTLDGFLKTFTFGLYKSDYTYKDPYYSKVYNSIYDYGISGVWTKFIVSVLPWIVWVLIIFAGLKLYIKRKRN